MKRIRKAVIPAAGLGTRFLPATKAIPKEMIPIVDTPMIQLIVEEAIASGIEEIVLITARNKGEIEDHFDYNYELEDTLTKKGKHELAEISRRVANMARIVSIRQQNPMGLGHAVLCAESVIGNEPFAVLLGDDLIDSKVPATRQLIQVHEKHGLSSVAIMEVAEKDVDKYGIVSGRAMGDGVWKVDGLIEKPPVGKAPSRFAIPGRYVLTPEIFKCLKETQPGKGGEIQLTDGLELLAKREGLLAFEFQGTRYDTGDRLGFIDATLNWGLKRPELIPGIKEILKKYTD